MVEQIEKTFIIHESDLNNLLNELKRWDIIPEETDKNYHLYLQSNNKCYHVSLYVSERLFLSEVMSLDGGLIKTFEDIQMNIFNKIIWNWR